MRPPPLVCALSKTRADRRTPILCYVTDRKSLPGLAANAERLLVDKIAVAIAEGIDWVQIREKDLSAKQLASVIPQALSASLGRHANARTRVFLNDRVDLAITTGLSGVHLGGSSLPVREAKKLARRVAREREFLVGASCHSLEFAKAAESADADYIFLGRYSPRRPKRSLAHPKGSSACSKFANRFSSRCWRLGEFRWKTRNCACKLGRVESRRFDCFKMPRM